jgi:GTPase KRas protein
LKQFLLGVWDGPYDPYEDEYYRKQVVVDNEGCLVTVLDPPAPVEYAAMRDQYVRSSHGILLIYSITSRESFEKLHSIWLQIKVVKESLGQWQGFPIFLVGNKTDLEDQRQVSIKEGQELASMLGCYHAESSPKTNLNVEEVMYNLVRQIRASLNKEAIRVKEESKGGETKKAKADKRSKSSLWKRIFSR